MPAFAHELGVLLHFKDSKELQELVILDPQWLVNAISCVICEGNEQSSSGKPVHPPARTKAADAGKKRDYEELVETGRVSRPLLGVLWGS